MADNYLGNKFEEYEAKKRSDSTGYAPQSSNPIIAARLAAYAKTKRQQALKKASKTEK